MGRFCYCSRVVEGKANAIREHWRQKVIAASTEADEEAFWQHLGMTGFESWLQLSAFGDLMIHCLEGESLATIFQRLREQIAAGHRIALKLHKFYQDVLGKDYRALAAEPHIEALVDLSVPISLPLIKRAFVYPLLPDKEQAHRHFRATYSAESKKAYMRTFGVARLSVWLQTTSEGQFLVHYTERRADTPASPEERLRVGQESLEWQEVSALLMDHTGLSYTDLSPNVEWLTCQTGRHDFTASL